MSVADRERFGGLWLRSSTEGSSFSVSRSRLRDRGRTNEAALDAGRFSCAMGVAPKSAKRDTSGVLAKAEVGRSGGEKHERS